MGSGGGELPDEDHGVECDDHCHAGAGTDRGAAAVNVSAPALVMAQADQATKERYQLP